MNWSRGARRNRRNRRTFRTLDGRESDWRTMRRLGPDQPRRLWAGVLLVVAFYAVIGACLVLAFKDLAK